MLNANFEIWKGRVELCEPMHESCRAGTLIIGGIMVLYIGCKYLGQLVELIAVDDLPHLLLCADVFFLAHEHLLWLRYSFDPGRYKWG